MKKLKLIYIILLAIFLGNCGSKKEAIDNKQVMKNPWEQKINQYAVFPLTTDTDKLSENEKKVIPLLIEAARLADDVFWQQTYGDKNELKQKVTDPLMWEYVEINYGPWDRLDGDKPFVPGIGPKPAGANFYPHDMTKEEFEAADLPGKDDLYTILRRDDAGKLYVIPYHKAYKEQHEKMAALLRQAASITDDQAFAAYLRARADALLTDNYRPSDMLWMDMKNNHLDLVIGPIETYEDQLFGYKAAHEAYVLVKDMDWSEKLKKFIAYLPELQKGLPVAAQYKQEDPGTRSDLNAYDAIFYAGEANTGGKTIAINLPNDEEVQLQKGSRRLQLKNVMRAKFEKILVPMSRILITPEQRQHVNFDAFFANTMFHEVAHGLGIKNTITGKGPVRTALKETYSAIEEGKADILGLYMVSQLHDKGALDGDMRDYMTTFVTSIFRSIRFGAHEAHGMANLIRFNYFMEKGAIQRLPDGTYRVNYDRMPEAMKSLSSDILTMQGDGDYQAVKQFIQRYGQMSDTLHQDLERVNQAGIPVDIRFRQGLGVLGLK